MQDAHSFKTPANSNSNLTEANVIVSELSDEAKLKMEVIKKLSLREAIAQHTLNGSRKQQKNLANQCEQCGD
ncbi:hypothetical protein [Scytonema sp. PRP1]|uniref:hypothetical protein n=1 Tax=Scytonema sp. PRP1 TaxID=3120513 RepID=UPI00300CE5DC